MTSSEAIAAIKQELFSLKMERKNSVRTSKLKKIVNLLLNVETFYLLAEKGTSLEDWEQGNFLPDTSDKTLIVFLDEDDITVYANKNGFSGGQTALYGCVPVSPLLGIIQMFLEQGAITTIRLYPRMPLVVDIPASLLAASAPDAQEAQQEQEEQEESVESEAPFEQPQQMSSVIGEVADLLPEDVATQESSIIPESSQDDAAVSPFTDVTELPVTPKVPPPQELPNAYVDDNIQQQKESALLDVSSYQEPETTAPIFATEPKDPVLSSLVKEIKSCLDMTENRLRKQVDPGLVYNNVHSLIGKLLFANPRVDIYKLENTLGLPGGFLALYIKDKVSSSISKEKLVALLNYYGLAAYTYQFKKYCNDLRTELRDSKFIDVCDIRAASVHTKETFELLELNRGTTEDGFYVYGARFQSTFRVVDLIVSTPLGLVIGKHYELFNLPPLSENSQNIPESRTLEDLSPAFPRERSVEEVLMDSVISYFKKEESVTVKEAKKRYAVLDRHPDIQMEFAKFTQTGRPGKIKVREYSANYLIQTLHFTPYEAYVKLCELRDKPTDTLQFLKYRERDPQYRKKKNNGTA